MDKKPVTGGKADRRPPPQPIVLTPEEMREVSGGLNPQPLPPCAAMFAISY